MHVGAPARIIQTMLDRSVPRLLTVALACAGLPLGAHAQVYRCEKDAVTVYSDKPCAADAKPAQLPPAVVIPAGPTSDLLREAELREQRAAASTEAARKAEAVWQDKHAAEKAEAERLRSARVSGVVVEGMTTADVRHLHGEPMLVSHSTTSKGMRETWSYAEQDGKRLHVTFTDGRVSAVRVRENKK